MKTSRISTVLALLTTSIIRAQVVNDGETNTLSNVTNTITGDVTVGTNGSFTLLILSDNALLTNSVNGLIGRNNTANSNEVRLVSPSARWFMGGSLFVGTNGAANRLLVSNGATVLARGSGTLGHGGGFGGNANSNSATVSGSGSLWSNGLELVVGELGFANRLEVNDGGWLVSSNGVVGRSLFSPSNTVVVTGPGSVWSNRAGVNLGGVGSRNLLVISNGGWMVNSNANIGESSLGNLALVTGINSTWSNRGDLFVGNNARENQLVVSNGALVVNGIGLVGNNTPSSNNSVVVNGVGSFWSNRQFMIVGEGGGGNTLEISGGGKVYADSGTAGDTSSGNLALITDPDSLWTNRFDLTVGYLRGGNQMVISNGGTARSADGYVGRGSSGTNCQALVTGAGSVWDSVSSFNLGGSGSRNLITVDSGGLLADNTGVIGINFNGTNNLALITGPGSAWSNRLDLQLGQNGSANQLVVSNGALVYSGGNGAIGISGIAGSNSASVTGAGSIWTNRLDLLVGQNGSSNRLVVSDGAVACAGSACVIGVSSTANSNSVLVTDSGSQFLLTSSMLVGSNGSMNRLVISNGAFVSGGYAILGYGTSGAGNEALVTGPGSVWSNRFDCQVGDQGSANRLVVSNGGMVLANVGYVGTLAGSSSNLVTVTGPGSTWTNADDLVIGDIGPGNRLVVSNGGKVQNLVGFIGLNTPSSNNTALITGPGSQWTMPNGAIFVSISSSVGNQLVISNGALAVCGQGWIGFDGSPGPNEAVVTGTGSTWSNNSGLNIGRLGNRNRLVVSNAALAVAGSSIIVGGSISSTNNRVVVDGGTLRTTNAAGTAFFDVRRGTNVFNSGLIEVDRLFLTNALGRFEFNGGTLITRRLLHDNTVRFTIGLNAAAAPAVCIIHSSATDSFIFNDIDLGRAAPFSQLIVTNGGRLTNDGFCIMGQLISSGSNSITLADPGSQWSLTDGIWVGDISSGNRLVISNGALLVTSDLSVIGNQGGSSNNQAIITGSGTTWNGTAELELGGRNNRLLISDGAIVRSLSGLISYANVDSSNNIAVVSDPGSLWTNATELRVGSVGPANQLVISNNAVVSAGSAVYTGFGATSTNNRVTVANAALLVTNGTTTGLLEIRRGTNVLNSGLIEADILRMTNGASGRLEINSGTLSIKSSRVIAGNPLLVGDGVSPATLNLAGNGTHDFSGTLGLIVRSNATLTGNGSLVVQVQVQTGAQLVPGASIGKISLSTPPSFAGTIRMEIAKNGAAVTNDQIQVTVTGTVTYGGALVVSNLGPSELE